MQTSSVQNCTTAHSEVMAELKGHTVAEEEQTSTAEANTNEGILPMEDTAISTSAGVRV